MVNKEKLYRMIALARYEKKNEDKALRINKTYEQDFVSYALIRNFFLTTIAFVLLLIVFVMYNMDFWLSNLNNLNFQPLIIALILGYLIMLGVYSVIAFTIARLRYTRAANGVRQYTRELDKLGRIYREEDKLLKSVNEKTEEGEEA